MHFPFNPAIFIQKLVDQSNILNQIISWIYRSNIVDEIKLDTLPDLFNKTETSVKEQNKTKPVT